MDHLQLLRHRRMHLKLLEKVTTQLPSLRLANIRKKFIIALPQQQQLDCPLTCWITKEIFKELVELFSRIVSSMTVNNGNDGFGNIIPSTLYAS